MDEDQNTIYISTESLGNYFFNKLVEAGCVPDTADVQIIADIAFDMLVDLGIVENVEDYEQDEDEE